MENKYKDINIGIALGGGAAKGWAHIGVLKELHAMGIYPNKISGCSAGAMIGAAYANNKLEELEKWVLSFTHWQVFSLMDLNWSMAGLLAGERVFTEMKKHIGNCNIEDMKYEFIAIAADLYSGQEIWMTSGNMIQAIRASASIPGLLSPVKQDGRWLVDGEMVNPVPVTAVKALKTDFVIAVDLNGNIAQVPHDIPVTIAHNRVQEEDQEVNANDFLGFKKFFSKNESPKAFAVMAQSLNILTNRHKRARLMGDPPNIYIAPKVSQIGSLEFHRGKEAIAEGINAVKVIAPIVISELERFKME